VAANGSISPVKRRLLEILKEFGGGIGVRTRQTRLGDDRLRPGLRAMMLVFQRGLQPAGLAR
jgi:hypothetical protein